MRGRLRARFVMYSWSTRAAIIFLTKQPIAGVYYMVPAAREEFSTSFVRMRTWNVNDFVAYSPFGLSTRVWITKGTRVSWHERVLTDTTGYALRLAPLSAYAEAGWSSTRDTECSFCSLKFITARHFS